MSIKRINEFPEGSGTITGDDLFLVMDNPSGVSTTKKISLDTLINTIPNLIFSNPSGIPGASSINNIVVISQTDYNELGTYDPSTLYIIT